MFTFTYLAERRKWAKGETGGIEWEKGLLAHNQSRWVEKGSKDRDLGIGGEGPFSVKNGKKGSDLNHTGKKTTQKKKKKHASPHAGGIIPKSRASASKVDETEKERRGRTPTQLPRTQKRH